MKQKVESYTGYTRDDKEYQVSSYLLNDIEYAESEEEIIQVLSELMSITLDQAKQFYDDYEKNRVELLHTDIENPVKKMSEEEDMIESLVNQYVNASEIQAVETKQVLNNKTNRFFDMVSDNKFWEWASKYFFKDKNSIISELASFDDISETHKIIEILNDLGYIFKENDIINNIQLKRHLRRIKKEFGYNEVYVLKTMIKLFVKLLNM